MPVKAILGMQWGDEGKGKVVDVLASDAHVVVRAAGGSNAGHTILRQNRKMVLHMIPSGILHEFSRCFLGAGMVIEPALLLEEIRQLEALGIPNVRSRLGVDPQAMLILPWHKAVERLREARPDALGTTLRGIGPAYESRASRMGVPLSALAHPQELRESLVRLEQDLRPLFDAMGETIPTTDEIMAELEPHQAWLVPLFADVSLETYQAMQKGQQVLIEGAQGVMLDTIHGTYPYVTSSCTLFGGLLSGVGLGHGSVGEIVGVCKAYATRVGNGPFPTELLDDTGQHLAAVGGEYGATTGRLRRCGWLDMVALRKACRLVGPTGLALTKVDVLCGLSEVRVAIAYEDDSGQVNDFPCDSFRLASLRPIYQSFAPWTLPEDASAGLPPELHDYIAFIETTTSVPVVMVSWGPEPHQTWFFDQKSKIRSK